MNGIGRDFLKAKPLCGFLAVDLYKQIYGSLSVPFFSQLLFWLLFMGSE